MAEWSRTLVEYDITLGKVCLFQHYNNIYMGARRQRAWAPTPRFVFRDGGTAQQGRNSRSIFLHKKQRRQTLLAPQHFFVNKYEQGRKGEKSRTHSRFWVVAKTKLSSTNKKAGQYSG